MKKPGQCRGFRSSIELISTFQPTGFAEVIVHANRADIDILTGAADARKARSRQTLLKRERKPNMPAGKKGSSGWMRRCSALAKRP
jgi:hypothetical protein